MTIRPLSDRIVVTRIEEAHQMHGGLMCVDEVVALNQHGNVACDDAGAVLREFVVMDGDDIIVRVGRASHSPKAGVLVFSKLIVGDHRIASRRPEAHAETALEKVVSLQESIAGIFGNLHAHVARIYRR